MQNRVATQSLTKPWRKALTANYTGSFPTINPDFVASQPGGRPTMASGQGLYDFGSLIVPSEVAIVPFGVGNANLTVKLRVWGFRASVGGFIGVLLWAGTCTLCDTTGTAGFDVVNTDKYCDAITTTVGTENVDCRTVSPGSELPAHVMVRTKGSEFLVLDFDKDGATSVNAIVGDE